MTHKSYNRIRIAVMATLLSAGVLPKAANAVLIDVIATGEVTEITNALLLSEFSLGQSMSMTITYDSDALPGSTLDPTQAQYLGAITDGSFTVGIYSGSISVGIISVQNNHTTLFDGIQFRALAMGADVGGLSLDFAGMIFHDPTAMAINSTALPLSASDLTGFPEQSLGLSFGSSAAGPASGVNGRFTSIEVVVRETIPEPSIVALMIVAVGILSFGSWRRRITQRVF